MLSRGVVPNACRLAGLFAVATVSTAAYAGPDWVEIGDAGSSFFSAQSPRRPAGAVTLNRIEGVLNSSVIGGDFEDLYFFRVVDPSLFEVSLEFADFNAVLYLFDVTVNNELYGRLGNDNGVGETNLPRLGTASNDGTGVLITQPGDYLIAVTGAGRVPISRTGPIFSLATTTEVSGPDGTGGLNPLSGWQGIGERGSYRVSFTSADFPAVPGPGTAGLMLAGLLCMAGRRKR